MTCLPKIAPLLSLLSPRNGRPLKMQPLLCGGAVSNPLNIAASHSRSAPGAGTMLRCTRADTHLPGIGCLPAAEDAHPPTAAPPRRRPRLATRHGARSLLRKTLLRTNVGRRKPLERDAKEALFSAPGKFTSCPLRVHGDPAGSSARLSRCRWRLGQQRRWHGGDSRGTAVSTQVTHPTPSPTGLRLLVCLAAWHCSGVQRKARAVFPADISPLWHRRKCGLAVCAW